MIQKFLSVPDNILKSITWLVCIAFLASVAISPQLWLVSNRTLPACPVISGIEISSTVNIFILAVLLISLVITLFSKKPTIGISLILLSAGILILLDINRLQPEFFVFLIVLQLLLFHYAGKISSRDTIGTLQWIVCGVYFWSGIHKLNSHYYEDVYLWFIKAWFTEIPEGFTGTMIQSIGYISPWIEILTPLALLFLPYKKISVGIIILLHAFILFSLTRLGYNFIVFPWNLFMAATVLMLFVFKEKGNDYKTTSVHFYAFCMLVWVLPVLNLVGIYDAYLSFDVYSGKAPEGIIFMRETMIKNLPEKIADKISISEKGQYYIKLNRWAVMDLKVPIYPEPRVMKRYQKYIRNYANDPTDVGCVMFKMGKYIEVK